MNYPISALFNQGCQSALVHAYNDGVNDTFMLNTLSFPNGKGFTTFIQFQPYISFEAGATTYIWNNALKRITASSGGPFSVIGNQTYVYELSTSSLRSGDFASITYINDVGGLETINSSYVYIDADNLQFPSVINLTRNRVVVSISIDGNKAMPKQRLCLSSIHIKSDTQLTLNIQNGDGSTALSINVLPSIDENVISLGPIGILLNNGMQIGFEDKTGLVTTHNASAIVSYKVLP